MSTDFYKLSPTTWELEVDYGSPHGNIKTIPITVTDNGLVLDNHLISWTDIDKARAGIVKEVIQSEPQILQYGKSSELKN